MNNHDDTPEKNSRTDQPTVLHSKSFLTRPGESAQLTLWRY
ncbi:hypothetical protein [Pseudomonas citri]|nr:hypothetical protein [Pseudomonas citri]